MFPPPRASPLAVQRITADGETVALDAAGVSDDARCPSCGTLTSRVHDRYGRRPVDLPWRGHLVRLRITVRRFSCSNPTCDRATFAEDFGPVLLRYARRTTGVANVLTRLGELLGGEAGARAASAAGLPVSPDTLLRLLRRTTPPDSSAPRVLGIDDFSLRRGISYGTILLDLETHMVIDLLEGRNAEAAVPWLKTHPSIEILVRDRSGAYADAGRTGAPQARQVADRFHLVRNASAAMEDVIQRRGRRVTYAQVQAADREATAVAAKPLSPTKCRQVDRRKARVARWEEVQRRRAAGESYRGIAHAMGINRRTVRRLASTPIPPQNEIRHPRPGGLRSPSLQPYVNYLQDRWQDGCHNIRQLRREIAAQGYTGSYSLLNQALRPWRPPREPPQARQQRRRLSVRWLCLRPPDQLKEHEQTALHELLREEHELALAHDLLQRFRALITDRDVANLDTWLTDAHASGLPPFIGLANGIEADRAAVDAALALPWSAGPTEGHIHRLKLIKRQGYGRMKFDLLRRRVLAS
jgi:transposase